MDGLFHLLQNQIDINKVPFSNRGSRLLIFLEKGTSRLYVKLAERLTAVNPALEAHLYRPPFLRDLSLLGPNGEVLPFEVITSPSRLQFQTGRGKFQLAFQDLQTVAFGLPPNSTSGIRFHVQTEGYKIQSAGLAQPIRFVSYGTNGTFINAETTPTADGYLVELMIASGDDCSLALQISNLANVRVEPQPFSEIQKAADASWQAWFDSAPPVAEKFRKTYAYAWWTMANNLVSPKGNIQFEAMMPSKANYIGLWLWDSALHSLAYRHVDPELARNQIRVFLANQIEDGMLPDAIHDEGVVSEIDHPIHARVTKPPILAWAALKIHKTDPDLDFLREIYTPLSRWNAWWFHQSRGSDGLAQYNHPYSSGLDDNPLWDEGMPVTSPDLNTYLCIQMEALSQIARAIGLEAEAATWAIHSEELIQAMVRELWDEEAGLFRALHQREPVAVTTPFNLYPLWTNKLPKAIQKRLVEHLQDPNEFWGKIMLPTVARSDPKYEPGQMWSGPVWANINYFFIEALTVTGFHESSRKLCEVTLDLFMSTPGMHEYYHSRTGKPPATATPMFGWTAALFIDLAIQASANSKNH